MGTPLSSRHLPLAAALAIASALTLTMCAPGIDLDQDDLDLLAPTRLGAAGAPSSAQAPGPQTRHLAGDAPAEWNLLAPAALVDACDEPQQGEVRTWADGAAWSLPLLQTDVDAVISGMVADVTIVQAFANPFDQPIEAVYVFPLPDDGAVDAMTLRVGGRAIEGTIHEREEAKAIYDAAKADGRVAARLDQERPNIFRQHIANLLPGELIEVEIHVVQPLTYADDAWSWAFPLVVGPRYVPPEDDPNPRTGALADLPAARAALDAPWSPTRTGNDVTVRVSLDAGLAVRSVTSPSHDLHVTRPDDRRAEVTLPRYESIPNKDFVLRWTVAGDQPEVAVLADAHDGDGVFMLMIQPPAEASVTPASVIPKEMVFVVDTSCSMSGFPLGKAKDAMRLAIAEMNPNDRFLVMDFNDQVSSLSARPLSNTSSNRARGLRYVDSFHGSGGTRMLDGIEASLGLPADPELLRTVLFLTDGYIGNEADILASVEQRLGASTRLFSLGIGSSVNRYLLERMAKVGRGGVDVVLHPEDADAAVRRFYDRIRNPVLADLAVTIEGVEVSELTPDPLPDLFTGQPLVLLGRYAGGGTATVTVTGRTAAGPFEQVLTVELPKDAQDHPGLGSLWARKTIEDLELRNHGGTNDALTHAMTELALAHGIVTRRTSFVAVDTVISNPGGANQAVDVPLETPEGVDLEAAAGPAGPDGLVRPHAPPACGVLSGGEGVGFGRGGGSGGLGLAGVGVGGGGSARGLGGLGTRGRGAGGSRYGTGGGSAPKVRMGLGGDASAIEGLMSKPSVSYVLDRKVVADPSPEDSIAGLSPFAEPTPEPAVDEPVAMGSIDKSVIDRVIKRHLNQIRYCYEKELKAHPRLAGKVVISFTIDADGAVSDAAVKSSTLADPVVEGCVRSRFARMRFPAPHGGGEVAVSYPLVFSNSQ